MAVVLSSAELYDPATGRGRRPAAWAPHASLTRRRCCPHGKVLVAGGYSRMASALSSAELYDPATGTWTATGSLGTARSDHTATLLPSARCWWRGDWIAVVVLSSAELYDPASGTWTATGSLGTARYDHTATLLPHGKVLVAGGING